MKLNTDAPNKLCEACQEAAGLFGHEVDEHTQGAICYRSHNFITIYERGDSTIEEMRTLIRWAFLEHKKADSQDTSFRAECNTIVSACTLNGIKSVMDIPKVDDKVLSGIVETVKNLRKDYFLES